MSKVVYLASPYTANAGLAEFVQLQRYYATAAAVHEMAEPGTLIYSPILHSVPAADTLELPSRWEYWRERDLDAIDCCDELWVLMLPGWDESKGVAEEAAYARDTGKPVVYQEWTE